MRLRSIRLQDFRNFGLVRLDLASRLSFFRGSNAQGKTNLLEAVGLLTALRSFRTADTRLLIREGQDVATVVFDLAHGRLGPTRVRLQLGRTGKEVWCDETRIERLADFLGRFPTVVCTSQDLQLVRGGPVLRRRWTDLTLAAMDRDYLQVLQTYGRALAERNSLLKRGGGTSGELAAFERQLAPAWVELVRRREAGLQDLGRRVDESYGQLTGGAETATLGYRPEPVGESVDRVLDQLRAHRTRDQQYRTTTSGPHRDDIELQVGGRSARDFGSEGQQRSLVLALRLAQAAWFRERSGVRPILLADDVLGELDADRRRRFWKLIDPEMQVLATGTANPDPELGAWQIYEVTAGQVAPAV